MNPSPYSSKNSSQWKEITNNLIIDHPLDEEKIVKMILTAWDNIFSSTIGGHKIGVTIFPKPQVIGALLHELIPAEMAASFPGEWRGEVASDDKDIVNIKNDFYSIELKTSSNPNRIFDNRSYAQKPTTSKKGKDGFYIAVNFEKFSKENPRPQILAIRFGWLDHSDWIGQTSPTGQQARLAPETYALKFKTLYINNVEQAKQDQQILDDFIDAPVEKPDRYDVQYKWNKEEKQMGITIDAFKDNTKIDRINFNNIDPDVLMKIINQDKFLTEVKHVHSLHSLHSLDTLEHGLKQGLINIEGINQVKNQAVSRSYDNEGEQVKKEEIQSTNSMAMS